MVTLNKIVFGLLALLVTGTAFYVIFADAGLKIRMDDDRTTFYTLNENSRWEVSGREYNIS